MITRDAQKYKTESEMKFKTMQDMHSVNQLSNGGEHRVRLAVQVQPKGCQGVDAPIIVCDKMDRAEFGD